MRRLPLCAVLAALTLAGCGPAEPPLPEADLALVGVVLIDPALPADPEPVTVLVAGDRIVEVLQQEISSLPATLRRVEGEGLYLMPGLWDLHSHLQQSGERAAILAVTQGVTGLRDLGGDPERLEALRDRIEEGTLVGPRVVRAGPTLNGAPNAPFHRVIATPEEARATVRELDEAGYDLLKTHNQTERDVYFALADEALDRQIPLTGHVPVTVTPVEACEAGQASIEHIATLYEGTYMAQFETELAAFLAMPEWTETQLQPLIDCFAEKQTLFVPTLRAYQLRAEWATWYDQPDPRERFLGEGVGERWREEQPASEIDRNPRIIELRQSLVTIGQTVVQRLHAAGAPIGAGTDFSSPGLLPGFDLHREIKLLSEAGLGHREALWASVRGPGLQAYPEPLQGRLLPGAPADLVLLRENPLESLSALGTIEAVVLRGRYLDRAELDQLLAQLEETGS